MPPALVAEVWQEALTVSHVLTSFCVCFSSCSAGRDFLDLCCSAGTGHVETR